MNSTKTGSYLLRSKNSIGFTTEVYEHWGWADNLYFFILCFMNSMVDTSCASSKQAFIGWAGGKSNCDYMCE